MQSNYPTHSSFNKTPTLTIEDNTSLVVMLRRKND